MNNRVAVVAEGNTERDFVTKFLQDEMPEIIFSAVNLEGGSVSTERVLGNVRRLLPGKFACITTLVDFYRFKGASGRCVKDVEDDMRKEACRLRVRWGRTQFLPHVQKHEFEALLFADRQEASKHLRLSDEQISQLNAIEGKPEDINHKNSPSKLIGKIHPRYNKPSNGVDIVRKIGLRKIMLECPHFAGWITELRKITQ